MLCNGVLCSIEPYWQRQIAHLSRVTRVVAWDYRGHGQSALPNDVEASSVEDHARDLQCLLDHLGIPRAILVGHSMGSQVILEAYRREPGRAAALVPICGTYGDPYRTFYGTDVLHDLYDPLLRWLHRHHPRIQAAARIVGRTLLPQILARSGAVHWYLAPWQAMQEYFDHLFAMDAGFVLTVLRRLGDHSAEDVLERIAVPTLLIAGDRDPMTPISVALEMHRRIPGAELQVVRRGTHVAQIEHPELVNLRIEKFLHDHALLDPPRGRRSANGRALTKPAVRTSPAGRPPRRARSEEQGPGRTPPRPPRQP